MISSPFAAPAPVRAPSVAPTALARSRGLRLSERAGFGLVASLSLTFLAGSSAPTPLYGVYQARWGFSPVTTTLVFAVYALAVLLSLLSAGSLSDHVGRRPVLLAATLMQASSMLLFIEASGVGALLAARVVQGVATGGALGAIGAGLVDVERVKGTLANAVAPMLGTATGGVVSGLMVQYLPAPTTLVYALLCVVFLAQAGGVLLLRETVTPRAGALASLRPQLRLPVELRGVMLRAAPLLIAAWSLPGFYGSLGPALIRRMIHGESLLLGGLALFVLASSGALAVLALRRRAAASLMLLGSLLLVSGVSLTLSALASGSAPLLFAGMAVAGAGFGSGFQGAIRSLIAQSPAHSRAGVLSVAFLISYLAMGGPAVLAGLRVVATHDLVQTAREYASVVIALSALALLGSLRAVRALPAQAPSSQS